MPEHNLILGDIRVLDLSEDVWPLLYQTPGRLGRRGHQGRATRHRGCNENHRSLRARDPHAEQSAAFLYLNTGKKSITLDIQSQTGAFILQRLAQECDILVEGFPAGYLDQLGLGYAALERLNPGLIYTSVTPFGQTGPYRDYKGSELVAQAMGALMHTIGLPDKEPLRIGGNAASYTTGMSAFRQRCWPSTCAMPRGMGNTSMSQPWRPSPSPRSTPPLRTSLGVRPPDGRVPWRRRRMAGCMPAWSVACARTPGRVSVR